jgi:hypothetical protein
VQLKRKSAYPVLWVTWIRQCHPGRPHASSYCCARISPKDHARGLVTPQPSSPTLYIRLLGSNGLLGPFPPSLSLLPSEPPTSCRLSAGASFLPLGLERPESSPLPPSLSFLLSVLVLILSLVARLYNYAMVTPMTNKSWVTTGWLRPVTYSKL